MWDLLFLPDGTLVSADSEGAVQFWDGATGTLLRRFAQHQADVLRLAAAPDGRAVWAAGVDPQLAVFHRVSGSDGGCGRWLPESVGGCVRALAGMCAALGAVLVGCGSIGRAWSTLVSAVGIITPCSFVFVCMLGREEGLVASAC